MAEQLRLDECLGQGSAVDRDEGKICKPSLPSDSLGSSIGSTRRVITSEMPHVRTISERFPNDSGFVRVFSYKSANSSGMYSFVEG